MATQIPVDAQGRVKAGTFATGVRLVHEPVHTAFTTSLYKNIYKNIRGFLARFRDAENTALRSIPGHRSKPRAAADLSAPGVSSLRDMIAY